jgi:AraC-like DNA-binding protein
MTADVLSDVLRTVRLTGAVYFQVTATSPWAVEAPDSRVIAQRVMPGAQHVIPFHVIVEGSCYAGVSGGEMRRLRAGDVIALAHGDRHTMSSDPELRARPDLSIYARAADIQLPILVEKGGHGAKRTKLICGFLGCDVLPFNPLLATLPRALIVGERDGDRWLSRFSDAALAEARSKRAGGETVLARLSELMFVEALRRHLERLPGAQTGWLAGLRDPSIGRALALLHGDPKHPWTLEALAAGASLSRSALAERFVHFVGKPPMQYLAQWRMQVASELLARGDSKVANIAREVGYDSEAAFSRAFKKSAGASPALWRKGAHGRTRGAPPFHGTARISSPTTSKDPGRSRLKRSVS